MILNTAPADQAVLNNISSVGQFSIKSSAKAFTILSSSLYANKIRAIIRELSCNAYDSHIAAKTTDKFEIHLPTQLEPWFSVKDYGTGLDHDQVTNIYTTYFESTKTGSNDFVGALGLGSKSPFAYTQSFTVVATKDGMQRIYTAFVNEVGVPSIALMDTATSNEKNGIEVKFAVPDTADFRKFAEEAANVMRWFDPAHYHFVGLTPSISTVEYEERDIAPGIHRSKSVRYNSHSNSTAIMGNIPYPIEVPMADTTLGSLSSLLRCGLVIEFNIGELEFQPSREGLSYTPQTISAIKNKLQALNDALEPTLTAELALKEAGWPQISFLLNKSNDLLWSSLVSSLLKSRYPLVVASYGNAAPMHLTADILAEKFNISVSILRRSSSRAGNGVISNPTSVYATDLFNGTGLAVKDRYLKAHAFVVNDNSYFVLNDTTVGAVSRAKKHFEVRGTFKNQNAVYVISAADKTKEVKTDAFFKFILSPAPSQIVKASDLDASSKKTSTASGPIPVVKICRRTARNYRKDYEWVWDTETEVDDSDGKIRYYLPLEGFATKSVVCDDAKSLMQKLQNLSSAGYPIPDLEDNVYGVRKYALEKIKKTKNWVNLDQYLKKYVTANKDKWIKIIASTQLARSLPVVFTGTEIHNLNNLKTQIADQTSIAYEFLDFMCSYKKPNTTHPMQTAVNSMTYFMKVLGVSDDQKLQKEVDTVNRIVVEFNKQYPLLEHLQSSYRMPVNEIANYINLINGAK